MASADGPPINEVALAISFDEQDVLAGPRLSMALQPLIATYPGIEEQLPYDMPEELPTRAQLLRPQAPNVQLIGPNISLTGRKHRIWLTSPTDRTILVQAQSDYFAVNWRFLPDGQRYPGFSTLKSLFFENLDMFNSAITAGGGQALNIRQVELSYVNIISPQGDYTDHSFMTDVLALEGSLMTNTEQLSIAYSKVLEDPSGAFFGRAYTNIQTAFRLRPSIATGEPIDLSKDLEFDPIINLNTSVRTSRHKSLSKDEVASILEQSHAEATKSFKSVTTLSAQQHWGLK